MKYTTKLKIKITLAISFFLVWVVIIGFSQYYREIEKIDKDCNEKLLTAAQLARHIVGDDFHNQIKSGKVVSEREDMKNILALSNFAQEAHVKYIYTIILDANDTLRFTSSSALEKELLTGEKLTRYFDSYEYYPKMITALESGNIVYDLDNDTDEWGSFRSIFVPYTTKSGMRYLMGVDIDNKSMEIRARETIISEAIKSIVLFFALLPLLLLYRAHFYKTNRRLRLLVDKATHQLRYMNKNLERLVDEKSAQILTQALIDPLTELPNRMQLQQDLMIDGFKGIAIVNIDDFKEVNDFFGIAIGDKILREFAKELQSFRLKVYRLNGDEFVIFKAVTDEGDQIEADFRSMVQALHEKVYIIDGETLNLNVTVGIAIGQKDLLGQADIALHLAKQTEQSIVVYKKEYSTEQKAKHYLSLSQAIRQALLSSRIICYYQPIVEAASGKIKKYETLVRMVMEDGTILLPGDFLMVAQKTKLYTEITKEVIRQACETFRLRPEGFSVNLSARDILSSDTVDFILDTIRRTDTANRIVFEILESEGIENYKEVSLFIQKMQNEGAKIAIDDFGSGYSSFENILMLNVDYIKIDGSLIRNIDHEQRHAIVVQTIIEFSQKIGAKTIAEFVSSEPIADKVKELGIDYSQGYFFGKPEPLPAYKT
ncbi:MAG: hypothetical protein A3D90_10940 [Sulfuricurvum sp. RIFCSPHIGHO2_02_FULL_43_9]|nr:MAG: hypothetical protein A3D90_10940 [Sulfuricurvum sp. RIFCSPHIGHO2_02_FULL_43_9]